MSGGFNAMLMCKRLTSQFVITHNWTVFLEGVRDNTNVPQIGRNLMGSVANYVGIFGNEHKYTLILALLILTEM